MIFVLKQRRVKPIAFDSPLLKQRRVKLIVSNSPLLKEKGKQMSVIDGKIKSAVYSKKATYFLTLLIAAATVFMCRFFVNTSDDYYTVGTKGAAELLNLSVYFGNGRFIGNFLGEYLTNRFYLNFAARSIYIFLFIILLAVLADKYRKRALIFSAALTFGMSRYVFREAVVWVHGFYNYFPPVVLLLLSLVILKCYYKKQNSNGLAASFALIPLGICQQLHSENSTLINTIAAVLVLIFVLYKKYKKAPAVSWAVSSVFGCAVMFFAPKLLGVADKMDEYRGSIADGRYSLPELFLGNVIDLSTLVCSMYVLWIMLAVILLIKIFYKREKLTQKGRILLCAGLLFVAPVPVFTELAYTYKGYLSNTWFSLFAALAFGIFIISSVIAVWKLYEKKTVAVSAAVFVLGVLSVCELIVVYPVGGRCLLISYALFSAMFIFLMKKTLNGLSLHLRQAIIISAILFTVIAAAVNVHHYVVISKVNSARMEYINQQLEEGRTEIEIINLPYESWLHNPNKSIGVKYSRAFNNGNPDEMSFKFISYEEYINRFK